MGKNIVQKIMDAHIVEGKPVAGTEVGIRIDQTLTQDATGTMAYLQFEAMGLNQVKTGLSVSYVDHNTIQEGFENADDHKYLETVARKFGVRYSRAGNGICHQVHLERFGVPGAMLLGSDSHTPTAGGLGMPGIGAGGLDVAVAMAGGLFYLTYPKVVRIQLQGNLPSWVEAKDVILKVLEILSTKGNVGYAVEYGGDGAAGLSVPQRATITNMGAELGVTFSVFPSDENTRAFLEAQGRGADFAPLAPDPDARYEREIEIDLGALIPLAACPHSPGNIKPVRELGEIAVNQVCVGSCTNASLNDIMLVAALLKGKKIAPSVSLGVSCGTRQVQQMAARNGALAGIVAAGGRILENVCGFCIGNSMAPETGGVSVRTSNRNFYGRSGTESAGVYLVSPGTAVAAALAGRLVDPGEYFANVPYPSMCGPDHFTVDDSMIVEPDGGGEIVRGPNIGKPPSGEPCPDIIRGVVAIYLGDKITTDHIMPAGSRLKYRSNIARYASFVFEREDPEFAAKALENKETGIHNIIVAGESYGQGSSREHAAICPMFLGVRMVVARSIERIHKANLINFGIIPALFENGDDYSTGISRDDRIEVANVRASVEKGIVLVLVNKTRNREIPLKIELSQRERNIILAGGLINLMKNDG